MLNETLQENLPLPNLFGDLKVNSNSEQIAQGFAFTHNKFLRLKHLGRALPLQPR